MSKVFRATPRRGAATAWSEARKARTIGTLRRRTPEGVRQEIIQVARKYVSKHGFRDLTVEKLMRDTRLGRSAFYAYFKDVYELAEIFIHELAEEVERGGSDWFEHDGNTIERIRSSLRSVIGFWTVNGPLISALELAALQDERLQRIWSDKIALGPIRRVEEAIRRDQAAGLIDSLDPHEMSIALNRFNLAYLNLCFGSGRLTNVERVLATMERVWIGSLYSHVLTSKAREQGKKG